MENKEYFKSIQKEYGKRITNAIAKMNHVDKSIVKGNVYNPKKLMDALAGSSKIWTGAKAQPSSSIYKIRFATLMCSYVLSNIQSFTYVYYSVSADKDGKSDLGLDDVVKLIFNGMLDNLCKYAVDNDMRFHGIALSFAIMDSVASNRACNKKKRSVKIVNSIKTLNFRIESDDSSDDETFGGLLRLTYLLSTRVPTAKKADFFVEGYEFDQKATTYHMVEKLGKEIRDSSKVNGTSSMLKIFMDANPLVTSQYRGVDENMNLYVGSMALSYMKFINNGTAVGNVCYVVK